MIESAQGKILFSDKELACRHCGKLVLAPGFAEKLKELRLEFGLPMTLSSCCRCSEHNRQEGGNAGSFHLTENVKWKVPGTCAIDVVRRGAEYDRKTFKYGPKAGLEHRYCQSLYSFRPPF